MPDNKEDRGPQDRSRINVHEDYEVRYWSNKFSISAEELREAVSKAGVSAHAVEEHLKNRN